MVDQLPAIVVLTPLFASLVVTLLGIHRASFAFPVAMLGLAATLAATIALLLHLAQSGAPRITYFLGGWSGEVPIGIHLSVDTVNGFVLCAIALVAFIAGVFSLAQVPLEVPDKIVPFYTLFLLLISGLLGMTISADAFNVFVLLEVASLTSYALVAIGGTPRGALSAFNYVIMGTVGGSLYLLGVGYLFAATGSLNMADIRTILEAAGSAESSTVRIAFVLMLAGLFVKMAFFPLHGWIANAYSCAPTISSSILAPLVTKVSIYVMIRIILDVFGVDFAFSQSFWSPLIIWLAVLAILAGSVLAFAQTELRRMLCYLVVAEVGYMVGGVWLANHWGMVGAVYHILSDALMTLCLFLFAGVVWAKTRRSSMASLDGLMSRMPLTMAAFLVAMLSMIGVPPTCGFFSKWYLIRGGLETGHYEYVVALLISSLVNALLFFRILETLYFGKEPAEGHVHHHEKPAPWWRTEAPPTAVAALWMSAFAIVALGIFHAPVVSLIERTISQYLPLAIQTAHGSGL